MIFGNNEINLSPTTPKLTSQSFGTWGKNPLARKDAWTLGRTYLLSPRGLLLRARHFAAILPFAPGLP